MPETDGQICFKDPEEASSSTPSPAAPLSGPGLWHAFPGSAVHSFVTRGLKKKKPCSSSSSSRRNASICQTTHKQTSFLKDSQAEVFLKNEVRHCCSPQKSHLDTLLAEAGKEDYLNCLSLRTWGYNGKKRILI